MSLWLEFISVLQHIVQETDEYSSRIFALLQSDHVS